VFERYPKIVLKYRLDRLYGCGIFKESRMNIGLWSLQKVCICLMAPLLPCLHSVYLTVVIPHTQVIQAPSLTGGSGVVVSSGQKPLHIICVFVWPCSPTSSHSGCMQTFNERLKGSLSNTNIQWLSSVTSAGY